jgi:predicted polyphosphate/ATP-dependent NAD kinase
MKLNHSMKEHLAKIMLQAALAGYHHLSEQYQRTKAIVKDASDYDLFDMVKSHPAIHLTRLLATVELMQRGYLLSEIHAVSKDPL